MVKIHIRFISFPMPCHSHFYLDYGCLNLPTVALHSDLRITGLTSLGIISGVLIIYTAKVSKRTNLHQIDSGGILIFSSLQLSPVLN